VAPDRNQRRNEAGSCESLVAGIAKERLGEAFPFDCPGEGGRRDFEDRQPASRVID